MTRLGLVALVALSACGVPDRSATTYADDPAAATVVVADCDAGRARPDCEAAMRGVVEARRRERLDAYRRAF